MKIVMEKPGRAAELAAARYKTLLGEKPDAVLGFDADGDLSPLYARLAELPMPQAEVFGVSELVGAGSGRSNRARLEKELLTPCGIAGGRTFFPCVCPDAAPEELRKYDDATAAAGGMDLIALSVGRNGRIGFNEPATPFESYTHIQKLTDPTRLELGVDAPEDGATMGIKTIMAAKAVVLFAFGQDKADIVHKMVYGKTVTFVPASMLQLHLDMTLYLDEAAASKLD